MPLASLARKDPRAKLARALPLLCLLAFFAALLWPALDPEVQLYYRDTTRLYYPVKRFIAEELQRGRLPFWDPWTEAGTSLLGQVTPALLHPFTLLYLLFSFEWAFKLNHLLALPLAGLGTYLLSRRLGTSRAAAALGGICYGGCGYLASMAASNLPYAVGPATVPLAIERLLAFLDAPGPWRLFLASGALALCAYAGEPQSMLFAGLIGGLYAVTRAAGGAAPGDAKARARRGLRCAGLVALWGTTALLLSAPASFPAAARLTHSRRLGGVSRTEGAMFSVAPARLFGYALPLAFDDPTEPPPGIQLPWSSPYREYLSWETLAAFSDSITIGPAAALLALFALGAGRKGRFLLLFALVMALASSGDALGVQGALIKVLPPLRFFRYGEKYAGPASLLIGLAAALGTEVALGAARRATWSLAALSGSLAAAAGAAALLLGPFHEAAVRWLIERGASRGRPFAESFLVTLEAGLLLTTGLCAALALVALLRVRLGERLSVAPALAALVCAASSLAVAPRQLLVLPTEVIKELSPLAADLFRRAGPSEGRWRLFTNTDTKAVPYQEELGERVSGFVSTRRSLLPQFETIDRIESASQYFTVGDSLYGEALRIAPRPLFELLDVRFALLQPLDLPKAIARQRGFVRLPQGYWLGQYAPQPRARLAVKVLALDAAGQAAALVAPSFEVGREATVPLEAAGAVAAIKGGERIDRAPALQRPSTGEIAISSAAPRPALLVVSEHFDEGWQATIDGADAKVLRTDLAVLGVPVPSGEHEVKLRFVPQGLRSGIVTLAATIVALLAWAARRRKLSPE